MLRWLALFFLLAVWVVVAVVVGATNASSDSRNDFEVTEAKKPRMCVSKELKINMPCALLIQLLIKERGGDPFCTLHSCPMEI